MYYVHTLFFLKHTVKNHPLTYILSKNLNKHFKLFPDWFFFFFSTQRSEGKPRGTVIRWRPLAPNIANARTFLPYISLHYIFPTFPYCTLIFGGTHKR